MRPLILVALLALAGCASTLDAEATAQNARNVREIATENEVLHAQAKTPETSAKASHLRNVSAIELAERMQRDSEAGR